MGGKTMKHIPEGYIEIKDIEAVYINEKTKDVIILGQPEEEDESHDCDYMGCGWSHVLIRARIRQHKVKGA
jgi:hypothetical protein